MFRIVHALKRILHPRRLSPLREELRNLQMKHALEAQRLDEVQREFWAAGGVCCPCCGVPGYSAAVDAQARREQRIQQLQKKLNPGVHP